MRRRIDVYRAARHADEADDFGMLGDGEVLYGKAFKSHVSVSLSFVDVILADKTLLK
jgi:hypothetical protein